jgi:hypothetical protein
VNTKSSYILTSFWDENIEEVNKALELCNLLVRILVSKAYY